MFDSCRDRQRFDADVQSRKTSGTRTRKRLPRPPMPISTRSIERKYAKALKERFQALRREFKEKILSNFENLKQEVNRGTPQALRVDDPYDYISRLIDPLTFQIGRKYTKAELLELALDTGKSVNSVVKRSIDNQWRRVLGINPIQGDAKLLEYLKKRAQENVDLITSIDERYFPEIRNGIVNAIQNGADSDRIADYIDDRFDVMESRSTLIAVDQVGKLTSQFQEYRQRELGVTQYVWTTAGDERVRPSHVKMDGTVQSWEDPPTVDGEKVHPGIPINCRCIALPDLSELI